MGDVIMLRPRGRATAAEAAVFPATGTVQTLSWLHTEMLALETALNDPAIEWQPDIRAGLTLAHDRLEAALLQLGAHLGLSPTQAPLARAVPGGRPLIALVQP